MLQPLRPLLAVALVLGPGVNLVAEPPGAADVGKAGAVRTDRFGDPLPPDAVARLGTLRLRNEGKIYALAFTADGRAVASAGEWGIVRLWDVKTGAERRHFPGHDCILYSVVFSPDGRRLAVADHHGWLTGLWDPAQAKPIVRTPWPPVGMELMPSVNTAGGVCFSPDGTLLAYINKTVRLCEASTGRELRRLAGERPLGEPVLFSPDGKVVACVAGSDAVVLLDAASGKPVRVLPSRRRFVYALAFSPGGEALAVGTDDGSVSVRETATGKEVRRLTGHGTPVNQLAFSRSGTMLASGSSDRLFLWDAASGKEFRRFTWPQKDVNAMALSPDGRLVATGGQDGTVRLWEVATGERVLPLDGHEDMVRSLAFSPRGDALASAGDDSLRVWSVGRAETTRRLGEEGAGADCVCYSADGTKVAAAGWSMGLRLWETKGGKPLLAKHQPNDRFSSVLFSPCGDLLLTREAAGPVAVWRTTDGTRCRRFGGTLDEDLRGYPVAVLSPSGELLATGGMNQPTQLWRVADGRPVRRLGAEEGCGFAAAWSPDGRVLAVADKDIRLWAAGTGEELLRLTGHGPWVFALVFSPDGKALASAGSDEDIRLWEVATGAERRRFRGHRGGYFRVQSVAFSADGRLLASGGEDTTILLWDVTGLPEPGGALTPETLTSCWEDLARPDAQRAYAAICRLIHAPGPSVPFLSGQLQPVPVPGRQRLTRLVRDLDSDDFAVRTRAHQELETLDEAAMPALKGVLQGRPSPEVRRRAGQLLERLSQRVPPPERLRALRAVEALEHIATPEARDLLRRLAGGAPEARVTNEAKASLDRLDRRPPDGR